jgi:hypothetical protein
MHYRVDEVAAPDFSRTVPVASRLLALVLRAASLAAADPAPTETRTFMLHLQSARLPA